MKCVLLVISWLAGSLCFANAQPSASLAGQVVNRETDATVEGATVLIEGAPLTAISENARRTTKTNREGRYRFNHLPVGQYELSVTLPGFVDSTRIPVELTSGENKTQDVKIVPTTVTSAYEVEDVPLPENMSRDISGVSFTPDGKIVVSNRAGEVWIGDLVQGAWRRFAYGLYEPFGLTAESDTVVYVIQRPEITRLRDTTGDGFADSYQTLNESWGLTGNYHEFAYGFACDSNGNFYGSLGMASVGEFDKARGPLKLDRVIPWDRPERLTDQHRSVARYQGWVFQVTTEGEFVPWATGFRQPLGLGLSPNDELFVTDVAGSWIPSSILAHVRKGKFYGHPDGLKWDPRFAKQEITRELLAALRTPPAVLLVHGQLGTSPGQPVWDTTGGKFGPFTGQMFIGDVTPFLMRVYLEKVAGEYQGAAFPFIRERGLRLGNMRNAFGPDGHLYLGQTVRGWREDREGLQRVVWAGESPIEILSMQLTESGFRLRFTEPMGRNSLAQTENYRMRRFQYNYHILDGSLRINEANVRVLEARPASSGRSVELELAELRPGFVYELASPRLRSKQAEPLDNPTAYYTLNRLLSGETFSSLPSAQDQPETIDPGPPDLDAGANIYKLYCAPCHQADGSGSETIQSASFIGEKSPLNKPDAELIEVIASGKEKETGELAMPAFGHALTPHEIQSVLAYIRAEFGDKER